MYVTIGFDNSSFSKDPCTCTHVATVFVLVVSENLVWTLNPAVYRNFSDILHMQMLQDYFENICDMHIANPSYCKVVTVLLILKIITYPFLYPASYTVHYM